MKRQSIGLALVLLMMMMAAGACAKENVLGAMGTDEEGLHPSETQEESGLLRGEPDIPTMDSPYALREQQAVFERGQSLPVYSGPGEDDARAAEGSASVSTNDWIQVFGRYEGRILIQYGMGTRYRIGWIDAQALAEPECVEMLNLLNDTAQITDLDCPMTDDPLGSKETAVMLPPRTCVDVWSYLGEDWAYVRARLDGRVYWGFIPSIYLTWG